MRVSQIYIQSHNCGEETDGILYNEKYKWGGDEA